ncbi:MAG: AAA family ATPase [Xenococcaceae cyanobacterium]
MLKKLRLERFKNFKEAELIIGNLTLLVGTNASGKSNIRDAFRFLHGICRGYNLADIIGEKWIEGGVLQWRGIRGGTREVTFQGESTFAIEVLFTFLDENEEHEERNATYRIEVDAGTNGKEPRVVAERLFLSKLSEFVFDSHPQKNPPPQDKPVHLNLRVRTEGRGRNKTVSFLNQRPVLSQLLEHDELKNLVKSTSLKAILALNSILSSMRFLDLDPNAMRMPSFPGQTVLGDRGENLSSVLQAICEIPEQKLALQEWIRELTPMDAQDFKFPSDFTGRILLTLIDNKTNISAYSASDGTLRFLAMSAALLSASPARFYLFEELENGIHPTRLHLLLQLIEGKVSQGTMQMVATTHSPHLLRLLSPQSLEYASLTYRLPDRLDAKIQRIVDIPG